MSKRFSKGSATVEALLCCILILFFLMLSLHVYFRIHASMLIEDACIKISHDVVSCTSLDEAVSMADESVVERLDHYMDIDATTIECYVGYAVGGGQEWRKGNFLTVEVSARTVSPFSSGNRTCRKTLTVMIERNGT